MRRGVSDVPSDAAAGIAKSMLIMQRKLEAALAAAELATHRSSSGLLETIREQQQLLQVRLYSINQHTSGTTKRYPAPSTLGCVMPACEGSYYALGREL